MKSDLDQDVAYAELAKARECKEKALEAFKKADAVYGEKLRAFLIPPLDMDAHMAICNSELMQLKERNDNLLYGEYLKGNYSLELMEKLYEFLFSIEFYDEDGEAKSCVSGQVNFKKCAYFLSHYHFSIYELLNLISMASKDYAKGYASNLARLRAEKRLENDPKQQALDEIFDQYEANKHQFKRRGYTSQFVREMHVKYPILTSIKTIENLVAALNKENELIPR